jgi:hypothetical protein
MKKTLLAFCGIVAVASILFLGVSSKAVDKEKGGWFPAGSHPKEYKMEIQSEVHHSGSKAAMMKYTASTEPSGFGTYMQSHRPGAWLGKKIKMTGWIKTENVDGWCGMWGRIDGDKSETIDFDNMEDRSIKGTTDWTKYEVILNVQKDAKAVAYGVLLAGKGTVYFDDISFDILGDAVPGESHQKKLEKEYPDKPANLNFED